MIIQKWLTFSWGILYIANEKLKASNTLVKQYFMFVMQQASGIHTS